MKRETVEDVLAEMRLNDYEVSPPVFWRWADRIQAAHTRALQDADRLRDAVPPDSVRVSWLEYMARNGGIFLYNGVDVEREKRTAVGIGLRPGKLDRTLREGIDAAMSPDWAVGVMFKQYPVDADGNVIDDAARGGSNGE